MSPAPSNPAASPATSSALPSAPVSTGPAPTPSTPPASTVQRGLHVYFLRGEHLVSVYRAVDVTDGAVATAATEALLSGPTAAERAAGMSTSVPAGTGLRAITVTGDTADVDLTGAFGSGGGSLSMTARLAQVVYTVTQFANVRRVLLRMDGERVTALGGEGVMLDHPLTRADGEPLLPPIFIDSPAAGEPVTSPLHVRGVANVFEGQFLVEVRGPASNVLAYERGVAAMGEYAPFDVTVCYRVSGARAGLVVGYARSAKDGSVIDVIDVPVLLR